MRNMKTFLMSTASAITVLFALSMTGCFLDPASDSTDPVITLDNSIGSLAVGEYKDVTGKIEASENITDWTVDVVNSSGSSVTTITAPKPSGVTTGSTSLVFGSTHPIRLTVSSSATAGSYKLKITATAGTTVSTEFPFTVTGGNTTGNIVTDNVTLGGHSNATYGSSVDLDNPPVVYMAADAKLSISSVDLVYTYSGVLNSPVLMTPYYAANSSGITAFQGWASPAQTKFNKVASPVSLSSITSLADIQALYNATQAQANATAGRVACAAGDQFVVLTDLGAYVLIQINTVSSDASGTATIVTYEDAQ